MSAGQLCPGQAASGCTYVGDDADVANVCDRAEAARREPCVAPRPLQKHSRAGHGPTLLPRGNRSSLDTLGIIIFYYLPLNFC